MALGRRFGQNVVRQEIWLYNQEATRTPREMLAIRASNADRKEPEMPRPLWQPQRETLVLFTATALTVWLTSWLVTLVPPNCTANENGGDAPIDFRRDV